MLDEDRCWMFARDAAASKIASVRAQSNVAATGALPSASVSEADSDDSRLTTHDSILGSTAPIEGRKPGGVPRPSEHPTSTTQPLTPNPQRLTISTRSSVHPSTW